MTNKTLLIIAVFLVGALSGSTWTYPFRSLISAYYQEQYSEMVFKCDHAMRENFLAKAKAIQFTNKQSAHELEASEIALIDCHEYDKFRKKLGSFGLTQDDLGMMGLNAIEKKGADIRSLVRIHEIRY